MTRAGLRAGLSCWARGDRGVMGEGVSERQRRDVIKALRDGVVPERGLHLLATGVEPFAEEAAA